MGEFECNVGEGMGRERGGKRRGQLGEGMGGREGEGRAYEVIHQPDSHSIYFRTYRLRYMYLLLCRQCIASGGRILLYLFGGDCGGCA